MKKNFINLFVGLVSPDIPIFLPDQIKTQKPDFILILPWNITKEITSQLSYVKDWGCKFVIAIPQLEII